MFTYGKHLHTISLPLHIFFALSLYLLCSSVCYERTRSHTLCANRMENNREEEPNDVQWLTVSQSLSNFVRCKILWISEECLNDNSSFSFIVTRGPPWHSVHLFHCLTSIKNRFLQSPKNLKP